MIAADDLSCRELVELVTDYLEGAMSPAERRRFEEHLALCPGCARYLDQMRRTISATGTLAQESIPAEAKAALMEVFRRWKAREAPG